MEDERNESEEDFVDEVGDLRDLADQLKSKQEFLSFLVELSALCSDDEECWERRVVHFVDVVEDYIRHDMLDIPEDQDWKVLANIFMVGAFSN
jgi:hypothetical protein